jgi:hypothetical protein
MASTATATRPTWFLAAALLAVVWNAFGVAMYLSSVGVFGDPMAGLSEEERAIASAIPAWIKGAFAIGTFAGLAGSVGLLLGRSWSLPVLVLSMIALLILEGWIVFVSNAVEIHGLAVPIAVSVGAILLVLLARYAQRGGLLR